MSIGAGNAIEVRALDVLFAERQGGRRARKAAFAKALRALDDGESRDAVRDATGVVPGVINANLDVPAGSIVVLMGLSGSGKSSLLRAVNGLNPSARGSIHIAQAGDAAETTIDVCSLKPRALRAVRRRSLAMVFQQLGAFGLIAMGIFSFAVFESFVYLIGAGALEWGPIKKIAATPMTNPARTTSSTIRRVGDDGREVGERTAA